jgi:acyl-CoA thioester hydrolase
VPRVRRRGPGLSGSDGVQPLDAQPPDAQPLEVWRGAVPPWRCDEMGHMNMRYYLAIAEEGLAGLAAALGQPRAFAPGAASTVTARTHHVRFLREARSADALYTTAGVLEMGEQSARFVQVIRHADGRPSATVVTEAEHATPQGRPFAWSARARDAAAALTCAMPQDAAPRSLTPLDTQAASVARADALGLACISRGMVTEAECDAFGHMTATAIMGRVSDGMTFLADPIRRGASLANPGVRVGGAALEYALHLRRAPRAGELFEVRSGFARLDAKVMHMRHWLLDPAIGEAYGVLSGVGASFDLDARRIIPLPEALRSTLATPGLD